MAKWVLFLFLLGVGNGVLAQLAVDGFGEFVLVAGDGIVFLEVLLVLLQFFVLLAVFPSKWVHDVVGGFGTEDVGDALLAWHYRTFVQ